MGDRALVVFKSSNHDGENDYSPVTYLHWSGDAVPELLAKTAKLMESRGPDMNYWAARFVGICHEHTGVDSSLSLGIWNLTDPERAALESGNQAELAACSHGDAGFIVVNIDDGKWQAYGGYLHDNEVPYRSDWIKAQA